jgi:hypothetical protein
MADDLSGAVDSGADSGSVSTDAGASSGPITLTESTAFIPPGGKDPLTWDKFQSSYVPKDELTRMRQRDAAERQQWQQQQEARIRQEYQQQFQQQFQRQQQGTQAQDFLSQLESAPYVDGKTMATVVREMAQQLSQSQAATQAAMQRIQAMQQQVQGVSSWRQQNDLQQTFSSVKAKLGLPENPAVDQILEDVYHSHTGWETEPGAFERMVTERWNALQSMVREMDRRKADAARAQTRPFVGQANGGSLKPGKALMRGNETPEAIADRLWPGMQSVES